MKENERYENTPLLWSGLYQDFTGKSLHPTKKKTKAAIAAIFFSLFACALVFLGWFRSSIFSDISLDKAVSNGINFINKQEFLLECTSEKVTQTCPTNYPTSHNPNTDPDPSSNLTCPSYFRWIHEDLRQWKETGITRDMIERARRTADFRLVIIKGKAYVEKYKQSIQTRDMFSLWGILQLLRLYPGRLPDLEIMFDCNDRPVVRARDFQGPNADPPPLFRYCSDGSSLDIVFPDWSFWGWAETNIRPWSNVLKDIEEGNNKSKWKDREPFAYWRGNPNVSPIRKDLMTCNVSDKYDWNARLYVQDWSKETKEQFKESNLKDQCTHRYKIYIEGWAWSVSEKYILACDAMTLTVRPRYHDFFSRAMVPQQHYWPIRDNSKCTSLKFAVEWGNSHMEKAQAIGEAGSKFTQEELKMGYVYDYMFHLLNEYAKLLKFKPEIPEGVVEKCSETVACPTDGNWRKFMEESMVKSPSDQLPCSMPEPYDPPALRDFFNTKVKLTEQVEAWENEYWQKQKQNENHDEKQ
ncbi:O-glucosyltransferase rumi homolog isoform X3 [Mangifera indica]|nr:O-glucosyltransferase rumi homolog isoform X3 [Mangifera indica]